jgi:recombinational DNA repair ATPase RecF
VYLSSLTLTDFRSYETAEVAFEPGVTTLVGLNGQGKTNLVEAVGYLANQTSHRVAKDLPLIRADCSQAMLAARIRWRSGARPGTGKSMPVAPIGRAWPAHRDVRGRHSGCCGPSCLRRRTWRW